MLYFYLTPPLLYEIIKSYRKGGIFMDIAVMIDLVQSVGFPIFVVIWLLVRSEKKDERMIEALGELKKVVHDYHVYMIKREVECEVKRNGK